MANAHGLTIRQGIFIIFLNFYWGGGVNPRRPLLPFPGSTPERISHISIVAIPPYKSILQPKLSVVIFSKLLYASPAWWGFTSAADKQRLEASLRRAVRSGLYSADDPSFSCLLYTSDAADE